MASLGRIEKGEAKGNQALWVTHSASRFGGLYGHLGEAKGTIVEPK